MSQIPEQILNQPTAPFLGLGQGMGMINPTAYQPNIQQPIAAGQNMQMNMGAEDQKNTESNLYIYN
jgi:hypothetical protein